MSNKNNILNVTEPYLPPLSEFVKYLEEIWESRWLTNNGRFHQELERRLAEHLGVPYISLFTNGTIALVTAMQAMRLSGEVITTPYSFVATTHSLLWNNLTPVFCDIDPQTFAIDPQKIEALITPRTTAIMPVHCYGYPCDTAKIQDIADRYGLKVIYDAAHAFGVKVGENSILNAGDLSVLSFHATKIFNTIEGGAVVSHDETTKSRIDYLKNFGFADELTVVAPGINGKMNEVQAAFGLLQLDHINHINSKRACIDNSYRKLLAGVDTITLPISPEGASANFSYFPVLINRGREQRDKIHDFLRSQNIRARRYFYPLISDMPMYRGLPSAQASMLPTAHRIADSVLCLPIHPNMDDTDVIRVCNEIKAFLLKESQLEPVEIRSIQTEIASTEIIGAIATGGGSPTELSTVTAEPICAAMADLVPEELGENTQVESILIEPFSLSVVIPVYRAEKYIEKALDSIFANKEIPLEVIAVNDGSPDNSLALLTAYAAKEPRLKVIDQENRGGAPAINRGLDIASNKYVMIMDCDDWLDESAIATLAQEANFSAAEIVAGRIVKTYSNRMDPAYDTNYIVCDETICIGSRPSIIQDGMYLGKIFLRDLLERENLRMDPNLLYADRPFVNVAMAQAKSIRLVASEIYYWRQREDPTNLSATDRMGEWSNLRDRVISIRVIRDELKARGKHVLLQLVDEQNLKRIFWHFKRKDPKSLRKFSEICRHYIRLVDLPKNKNLTNFQRELAHIIVNNESKQFPLAYYRWVARRFIKRYSPRKIIQKVKDTYSNTKKEVDRMLNGGRLEKITKSEMPDPILVVFESFFGKSYGGQPRYIYEELLRSGKAFRAVWVYQGKAQLQGIPGNVIQVHRGTTEYFHYLARARYWVNNIRFTVTFKPSHTTYLQTWHGTPLKRLGLDIEVSGPEAEARASFLAEAANWDYLIAPNNYSAARFTSAFNFHGKLITRGYPANDLLVDPILVEKVALEVRDELGIPSNKKVVMYAPTWRDDAKIGGKWEYRFQLKLDLARMKEELGADSVLLLRMHHLIADQLDLSGVEDYAIDVSKYNDPARLMAVTDLMISDYSSIFFDFANLGRPIIFYMYDLRKYSGNLRGFYFDPINELPGPIVYTFVDLLRELKHGYSIKSDYKEKMINFREKFCADESGRSAEIIVNQVFSDLPYKVGGK